MKWLITGDCHGDFTRFRNLPQLVPTSIICLGDFGVNFYLNKLDDKNKKWLSQRYPHFIFYCVRGNHEARPQEVSVPYELIYDENVRGEVYVEEEYSNIRFFKDWGEYWINDYHVAVIGGAYSVDKWWRLNRVGISSKFDVGYNNPKKTGWFPNEQLSVEEMRQVENDFKDKEFDFVFTHTCPIQWQPTDLFLSIVNQDTVDSSMELWMDELRNKFKWDIWCFGHYHADRIERPHVEQYFKDMEELDIVSSRWKRYDETGELDWWLTKSPNFYMGV